MSERRHQDQTAGKPHAPLAAAGRGLGWARVVSVDKKKKLQQELVPPSAFQKNKRARKLRWVS